MLPRTSITKYRHGFTLIELLIVIGILAAMASMIAPVLAQVQRKVQGYSCQTHLRQIGIATTLYMADYDEQFAAPNPEPYGWLPDVHNAYLKQWRMWICPSDTKAQVWDERWGSKSFSYRTSYIWNAYVFQGDSSDWRRSIHYANISNASTLVLWAEGYANNGWVAETTPISAPEPGRAYLHNAYGDNANASKYDLSAAPCPYRHEKPLDVAHNEGGNYAFADGHSKWLRPDKFTTDAIEDNRGFAVDDRSDPLVTNGARSMAGSILCPVLCCPQNIGTPPGDGKHPWFRP